MAEQQSIDRLVRGVESWNQDMEFWNAHPDQHPGRPDLSRANISDELTKAGRLTQSGRPDLRGYDLRFADLSGSILAKVDLSGARCSGADFKNAWLRGADLTNADCSHANFEGSRLDDSILFHTKLESSRMVGASLGGSRYWQADWFSVLDFFRSILDLGSPASLDENVNRVADLLSRVDTLKQNYASNEFGEPIQFYYRGEGTNYNYLAPGVMRDSRFRASESEMLVEMRSRRPEDFGHETTAIGQMVIAQHYRLPTRLLDVTRNPLVALFHAAADTTIKGNGRIHILAFPRSLVKPFNSDTVSVLANFARLPRGEQNLLLGKTKEDTQGDVEAGYNRRGAFIGFEDALNHLYQLIRLEKPSFANCIDPRDFLQVFVVEPQRSFERLRAQSGAFLLSAFHDGFDEESIRRWSVRTRQYHHYILSVPEEAKQQIQDELSMVNITQESLFPSLEETAIAVKGLYRTEDTSR